MTNNNLSIVEKNQGYTVVFNKDTDNIDIWEFEDKKDAQDWIDAHKGKTLEEMLMEILGF